MDSKDWDFILREKTTEELIKLNDTYEASRHAKSLSGRKRAAPPALPGQAFQPNPSDGASSVPRNKLLGWQSGSGSVTNDVYFGTTPTPGVNEFKGNHVLNMWSPGLLAYGTTYYWRIDQVNTGGTTTGQVWSFTTESLPPLPGQATTPSPQDSSVNNYWNIMLTWLAGSDAVTHDVYFGTNPTPGFNELQISSYTSTNFNPGTLSADTTYYWRVDEVNAAGTTTGSIWSFTTLPRLPGQATIPTPVDGATVVDVNILLEWLGGSDTVTHNVYFGTSALLGAGEFKNSQTLSTFNPGPLSEGTTYYWRIDEVNPTGTTTGQVWSFTTWTYVSKVVHFDDLPYSGPTTSPIQIVQHEGFTWNEVTTFNIIEEPDEPGLVALKAFSGRNRVGYFGWKQGHISRPTPFSITQLDFAPGNYNNVQYYIEGKDDTGSVLIRYQGFFDADTPQRVSLVGFTNIHVLNWYELPGKVGHPSATDGEVYPGMTNLHVSWYE